MHTLEIYINCSRTKYEIPYLEVDFKLQFIDTLWVLSGANTHIFNCTELTYDVDKHYLFVDRQFKEITVESINIYQCLKLTNALGYTNVTLKPTHMDEVLVNNEWGIFFSDTNIVFVKTPHHSWKTRLFLKFKKTEGLTKIDTIWGSYIIDLNNISYFTNNGDYLNKDLKFTHVDKFAAYVIQTHSKAKLVEKVNKIPTLLQIAMKHIVHATPSYITTERGVKYINLRFCYQCCAEFYKDMLPITDIYQKLRIDSKKCTSTKHQPLMTLGTDSIYPTPFLTHILNNISKSTKKTIKINYQNTDYYLSSWTLCEIQRYIKN